MELVFFFFDSVDADNEDEDEGGEYGRILESTSSSSSSSSFPNIMYDGNSNDTILRSNSMGNDAMVVASSAIIKRVAMRSDEVAMLSARSTGDNDDEQEVVELEDDCLLRSSDASLRNLI